MNACWKPSIRSITLSISLSCGRIVVRTWYVPSFCWNPLPGTVTIPVCSSISSQYRKSGATPRCLAASTAFFEMLLEAPVETLDIDRCAGAWKSWAETEADIRTLGERLGGYRSIERVELLPYHTLGVHKYEAMGLEYRLRDVRENTPEQIDRAAGLLREYFPTVVVN